MWQVPWFRTLVLVSVTCAAPVAAVFFLLPAKEIGAKDLDNPPLGRFVRVSFDRIEPLPWTIVSENGDTIVHHFALGVIGKRALIVETGKDELSDLTVTGEIHSLTGAVAKWAQDEPNVDARSFDAILEVRPPWQQQLAGAAAVLVTICVIVLWILRFRRRND